MVSGNAARTLDFSTDGQKVGLRFPSLNIPKGAKITKALISMTAAEWDTGSTKLIVQAEKSDNASRFATSYRNLSKRSLTSASAQWWPPSWGKGKTVTTTDLSKVVQEVVSRVGWKSGNAVAFIVTGDNKNDRQAVARNAGGAIILSVSYTTNGSTGGGSSGDDSASVSGSQKVWHSRLRSSIDSRRYAQVNSKNELDPLHIARTKNSYFIGRFGNMLETAYVLAYRETGDRKLMDFVNKFMVELKDAVKDHNGDGFRDILYRNKGSYYNKDTATMEEQLTHGTLASLTLELKKAGYSSTAAWWTSYLKNDYQRKWNKREPHDKMPDHRLTHPRANNIRYLYAMSKLTGESWYLSKARSEAALLKKTIRSNGWSHWFGTTSGCQPMVYVPLTSIALADLATNGSGLIDSATMKRAASAVAHKAMKNSSGTSLAGNICGSGSYGGMASIATFSYTQMAAWDASGRIASISERVYNATERYNLSTPIRTPLPAALTFVKGR